METKVICGFLTVGCVWVCTHMLLVAQWCLTLCHPMDCSPPGSSPGKNTGAGCVKQIGVCQEHLPPASAEPESCAAAVDPQHALKAVQRGE